VKPRSGSLCSGVGMLDRALEALFGVEHAWQAEVDPDASQVLAARWPGVPNLGDITVTDWANVDWVDLLAGGIPCTPFSSAGKRGGTGDERHLWPVGMLPGIETLLPAVVVLENVPNLLGIEAGSVFGQVLADLDGLGYTVAWTTVGACKVGACHHRHRLFVLAVRDGLVSVPSVEPIASRRDAAWAPVQDVLFGDAAAVRWPPSGVSRDGLVWSLPVDTCGSNGVLLPTPTARIADRWGTPSAATARERMESGRRNLEDAIALLPTPTARDATRGAGRPFAEGRPLSEVIALLPTPTTSDAVKGGPNQRGSSGDLMLPAAVQPGRFGQYEAAVRRHEFTFGTPAPEPTEPGRLGKPRLAAPFPEWMQALPPGWMTDVVGRKAAIRCAGNGVFGPAVQHGLRSLPTFPAAVAALSSRVLEVAA
jgi:DNA (cytosine-5)-methyltransferase 1